MLTSSSNADGNAVGRKPQYCYLNTAQVAAYTGLSESFYEKARVRGDGPPFIRIGSRVLYAKHCVDEWLAARAVSSTSDLVACNDNFLAKMKETRGG